MSIEIEKMPKLGFGLMRLPETNHAIDMEHVCKMVDSYMDKGFNYFDTAYVYHSGKSEGVAKEAVVKRYPRDSFYLATKLPGWELKCEDDRDRIFNEQLERAGVDYFDFYLLHSIEEGNNYNSYVKYNCFEWGKQKKAEGKIKHFGFSFHGTPELLEEILSTYPAVEFVQIQLNYADWDNPLIQSGRLYEILTKYKMPMIIMEPVKGGTLASTTPELEAMMKEVCPDSSIASWAFRFVASLDGVMTILSGMSNEEQMADNLNTFTNFEPLNETEKQVLNKIVTAMAEQPNIPCTACKYCVDGCPQGIQIPEIFKVVNTLRTYGEDSRPQFFYNSLTGGGGKAKDCIACGQCEGVCPQHLHIIDLLKEASEKLDQ